MAVDHAAGGRERRVAFEPRVALASLSGAADAAWARAGATHAGAALLGGIALDEPTRRAARALVERGREEFLPARPVGFVDEQLAALADVPLQAGVNVRAVTGEALARVAAVCARHGAVVEINAHCRQPEMCRVGAGEALLADADRLCGQVRTVAQVGTPVSVKVRAEAGVALPALARQLAAAGADILHVDAMDSESVIAGVAEADLFVVANNGVRDRASVREYLDYGADAVSVGRPSDDPAVLARVREATEQWVADHQPGATNGPPAVDRTRARDTQNRER
jgi:TIM-barrel protein